MCSLVSQMRMLAEILNLTLESGANMTTEQVQFAQSLQTLLQNAIHVTTARPFINGSDFGNFSMFSFTGTLPQNSTSTIVTSVPPTDPPAELKLHRLEIIKVVVLIAVISIILLSTCRMVFQLFVKFRPEKTP